MERKILGHIACPTCAEKMRITPDRNGDPFGYCEDGCGQQLRIGGNVLRVKLFKKRYPWAADQPVTVTESALPLQEKKPVTVTDAALPLQEKKPVTVTENPTPKKRSSMDDALAMFGVKS